MAVVIDVANIASGSTQFGTNYSFNVTCGASDNFLVVLEGGNESGNPPSGITYNTVALTLLQSNNSGGNSASSSIWYLANPITGSAKSLSITYPGTITASGVGAIPCSGVNLVTPFGAVASNFNAGSANPTITATGGVTGDQYVGVLSDAISTITDNQTNLFAINGINGGLLSVTGSNKAGSGSGAFSWTASSAAWSSLAVAIKAPAANPGATWVNGPPGPSLAGPFNLMQFRSFPFSTTPNAGGFGITQIGRHINHSRHRRN